MKQTYKLILVALLLLGLCVSGVQATTVTEYTYGTATASSHYTTYDAPLLFDGILSISSRWVANGAPVQWVVMDYGGSPHAINNYTFYTPSVANQVPIRWTLKGSNDNNPANEVMIDNNTDHDYPMSMTTAYNYNNVTNGVSYRYYNFTFTAVAGADNPSLWEIYLYNSTNISPVTAFTATPTMGVNPLTVSFNDTTTSASPITSYNASFGDGSWWNGTTFPATNITHLYSTAGNYTVDWYVTNAEGTGSASTTITVSNNLIANFTYVPSGGSVPFLVTFTDTSTNVTALIDSWAWDFGDGNSSAVQNPSHTYDVPGTHTANLTITNTSYSLVSTKLVTITVYKQPAADFSSFNTAGTAPFTTYFYDTSTNLNSGPYTYYTDFGDGNTSTEQNTYFTWNITGTYDINHCITDSVTTACNNKTAYVTVGTAVVAPVASFYGGPQLGNPPLKVFFTDVSSNTPTSWNWSFGDGTYSESQNPEHWFNRSGLYRVNLTATNTAGSNKTSQSNFVIVY